MVSRNSAVGADDGNRTRTVSLEGYEFLCFDPLVAGLWFLVCAFHVPQYLTCLWTAVPLSVRLRGRAIADASTGQPAGPRGGRPGSCQAAR